MIIIRSHIGFGAPEKQDTPEAHGSPLGDDEVKATKEFYDWPSSEPFYVPDEVLDHMRDAVQKGETEEGTWNVKMEDYKKKFSELADKFENDREENFPTDGIKISRISNLETAPLQQEKPPIK